MLFSVNFFDVKQIAEIFNKVLIRMFLSS